MKVDYALVVCPRCGSWHRLRVMEHQSASVDLVVNCDVAAGGCDKEFAARIVATAVVSTAPVDFPAFPSPEAPK